MVYDFSSLNLFTSCPIKYKLRMIDNLTPKDTKAALTFGAQWHKSMEEWHKTRDLYASLILWDKYKDTKEDDLRTAFKGGELLTQYTEEYPNENFNVLYNERGYAMELCTIDWKEPDILGWHREYEVLSYAGRFDKIIRQQKYIRPMEHKSTTRMGFTYMEQFTPNMQIDGYYLLCIELMGQCDGILVDAARLAKTAPKKGNSNFLRAVVSRNPEQLKWAKANIIKVAKECFFMTKEPKRFYQAKSQCTMYGRCEYRDLCVNNFDERIERLRFKKVRWNPTLGREEPVEDKSN